MVAVVLLGDTFGAPDQLRPRSASRAPTTGPAPSRAASSRTFLPGPRGLEPRAQFRARAALLAARALGHRRDRRPDRAPGAVAAGGHARPHRRAVERELDEPRRRAAAGG